jgi:hypothetical protein
MKYIKFISRRVRLWEFEGESVDSSCLRIRDFACKLYTLILAPEIAKNAERPPNPNIIIIKYGLEAVENTAGRALCFTEMRVSRCAEGEVSGDDSDDEPLCFCLSRKIVDKVDDAYRKMLSDEQVSVPKQYLEAFKRCCVECCAGGAGFESSGACAPPIEEVVNECLRERLLSADDLLDTLEREAGVKLNNLRVLVKVLEVLGSRLAS